MLSDSFPDVICTQVGSQGAYALSIPHNEVTVGEVHDALPLGEVERTITQKKQPKGRVRWTVSETLTLINAKQVEKNLPSPGGFMKQTKSAIEKWKCTSAQCHSNGLNRTATQCRDRWDHIQPDYKKIRHYERSIVSEHESYWNMTTKERIDKKLPANFTKEIFDAMEKHFGQNRTIHPGDMVIDTSASNYGAFEHNTASENTPLHKDMKFEMPLEGQGDTSIDRDNHFTGKKRKVASMTSGIKSTLVENNKKIISNLKLAEQGHLKRHEKYCSMFEQRMEIDEKYLKDHILSVQRMVYIDEQKVKQNPNSYVHSNIAGLVTIFEICKSANPQPAIVWASSSSVYGLNSKVPFSESDRTDQPASLYAATKKAGEEIAHTYNHIYGLSITGLRFFTVYGPWGRPDMAYFFFTKDILQGKSIDIYQGQNKVDVARDFTYIDDIVKGCVAALDTAEKSTGSGGKKKGPAKLRIYNLGNTSPVSVPDLVNILERLLKVNAKKNVITMPSNGDVPYTHANVSLAHTELGYQPTTDLQTGLKKFVKWYLSYYGVPGRISKG